MLPIIKLTQAWLDAHGFSLAEGGALLDIDQTSSVPAGTGDACPNPKCSWPNTEYQGSKFVADPATVNSETEHGREYVLCICGTVYWYAAVHVLNAPTDEARVRAASVTLTAKTGALQAEGQTPKIGEALPPGVHNTLDAANQIASQFRPEHYAAIQALIDNSCRPLRAPRRWQEYYETRSSFILPPFGPLKAG